MAMGVRLGDEPDEAFRVHNRNGVPVDRRSSRRSRMRAVGPAGLSGVARFQRSFRRPPGFSKWTGSTGRGTQVVGSVPSDSLRKRALG